MNWGVIGVLLTSIALGIGVAACWRFGTSYVARYTPALLAVAYYASQFIYPHPAFVAMAHHTVYAPGDQMRAMLLGISLLVAIAELTERLRQSVENNKRLREKLGYHRTEER